MKRVIFIITLLSMLLPIALDARDGGDIAVVDVDESNGVVKVKLLGACSGCPLSMITLTAFVERYLRTKIPEVKRIEPVL